MIEDHITAKVIGGKFIRLGTLYFSKKTINEVFPEHSNFNQDVKTYDPKRRKTLQVLFTNNYRLPQTDIDECKRNLHNCHHPLGTCINTAGSFDCTCKPGFEGDGLDICEGKKASSNQ